MWQVRQSTHCRLSAGGHIQATVQLYSVCAIICIPITTVPCLNGGADVAVIKEYAFFTFYGCFRFPVISILIGNGSLKTADR